jgi:hypothetical protein
MSKKEASLGLITTIVILAASTALTLTEFGKPDIAQGQSNTTSSSSSLSLTPEQKAAICDPNNPESKLNPVNTTESKICGIPVTIKPPPSNTTSAGTETSSGSLAPSVVPSPEG